MIVSKAKGFEFKPCYHLLYQSLLRIVLKDLNLVRKIKGSIFILLSTKYNVYRELMKGENRCKIIVSVISSQRNHTLFGSVVSAMAGVRPILPFLNRTQSLKGHKKPDIAPVIAVSTAATKMLEVRGMEISTLEKYVVN